jgi:hypothetical protein
VVPYFNKNSRKEKKLLLERNIRALQREAENLFFIIMYGRKHITDLKQEHKALRKRLCNDRFKKDLICIEKNSLTRQIKTLREQRDNLSSTVRSTVTGVRVIKTERNDTMTLDVDKLRGQRDKATALRRKSNTITAQRNEPSNKHSEKSDDLLLEAKGPAVATERDKVNLNVETEHVRGHFQETEALKEQTNTVATERNKIKIERDEPVLEVRHPLECTVAPEKARDVLNIEIEQKEQRDEHKLKAISETGNLQVRDVLRPETKELRSQSKDASEPKEHLTLEDRRQARYSKVIKEEKEAPRFEVEHFRSQCNEVAALKRQEDHLVLEAKRKARYTKAIKEERDALKLEVEHFRSQCNEVAALKEQRDQLMLEAKRQARYTKAIKEERDALKLEVEHFRSQCNEVAALKEQRDHLILEAKRHARNTKAIKEERDVLRLEVECFQNQCNEIAALKEQRDHFKLETKRQARCTKAIKEKREQLSG